MKANPHHTFRWKKSKHRSHTPMGRYYAHVPVWLGAIYWAARREALERLQALEQLPIRARWRTNTIRETLHLLRTLEEAFAITYDWYHQETPAT